MICAECRTTVTIFNTFYRKHGKATIYNPNSGELEQGVIFCSEKCFIVYTSPKKSVRARELKLRGKL